MASIEFWIPWRSLHRPHLLINIIQMRQSADHKSQLRDADTVTYIHVFAIKYRMPSIYTMSLSQIRKSQGEDQKQDINKGELMFVSRRARAPCNSCWDECESEKVCVSMRSV